MSHVLSALIKWDVINEVINEDDELIRRLNKESGIIFMVPLLGGSSKHVTHVWTEIGNFNMFKALVYIERSVKCTHKTK